MERRIGGVVVAFLLGAGSAAMAPGQLTPLALELDGTRVTLGSVAELVVRTTEARALRSASFRLEVRDRDGDPAVAFAALDSLELLSGGAGATIDADFDVAEQRLTVAIDAPELDLNADFGPLAVFRFAFDAAVEEGDRFEIWMDPGTTLLDAASAPVVTAVGRADLRVIEVEPGQGLGALGGEAYPGGQVVIGAVSERPFAIGSGTLELFYDAALFEPGYEVRIDARYGSATLGTVQNPAPGHLVIPFTSPDEDLNLGLHGAFVNVVLSALDDVAIGTLTAVVLGPATALTDENGVAIELEIDGEELEFIDPELVLAAGFEGGDLNEFFTVVD